jgi:hypothetical protein
MANVEQLKLIQAIVGRLANNSFLLKGWTITLVAGLSAFAKADAEASFALIAGFAVVVLGTLDAHYLALERKYRELYDAAAHAPTDDGWSLAANRVTAGDVLAAARSPSVCLLHGVALAAAALVAATT